MPKIENVEIYGLNGSFRASKLPMKVNPTDATDDYTNVIENLANTPIGSGHDNFLVGIVVQFDLTISQHSRIQLLRYHHIDTISSMSLMHMITKFDFKNMSNQYVDEVIIKRLNELQKQYIEDKTEENFYRLIYNIPSGFELTARMTTNYRQLKTMYAQRKNHRLPDWQYICRWIETLPYSNLITNIQER